MLQGNSEIILDAFRKELSLKTLGTRFDMRIRCNVEITMLKSKSEERFELRS